VADDQDLEKLLATLRDRIDQRRAAGLYPVGLEDELDEHFGRLTDERPPGAAFLLDQLDEARGAIQRAQVTGTEAPTDSRVPGGSLVHRAVGKAVARHVQGLVEQTQQHAAAVDRAVQLVADVASVLADSYDTRVLQQLDDLQVLLAEQKRQLNGIGSRLDDVTQRVPGAPFSPFYSAEAFTRDFRGGVEAIYPRYRDLAEQFAGCEPVLDVGFGRGEFLELLRDANVDAWGIEIDPALVEAGETKGLRVEQGFGVDYLRGLDDGSLGGLVMIQVIEHLPPQEAVEVVRIAADKVRRGGKVLIETVNPKSLYTYAHAFWLDPDHVRPVHPDLLVFLFREARFADVQVLDRSPVEENERLELLSGDDDATRVMNANFERINSLLYGPQDYAILATR
jgi:O-antigen chain-terminating methyltransferase